MFILAALLFQAQPQPPRRDVPDSGVIATNQRVTPAGVGTVLTGRVYGVRFGASSGDVWATVPGSVYHLAWTDNRVIARGVVDGRAGIQGIVVDPVRRRALVTSVGRMTASEAGRQPGTPPQSAARAAQLSAFADGARDVVTSELSSVALGEYIAGAPAVAQRANASGKRPVVVPLPANDSLAILDADDGSLLHMVPLGVGPIASVIATDGSVAYVSNIGGPKPTARDPAWPQCCDPRGERVRVDARGMAARGSVTRVDLVTGRVTHTMTVGLHPTALAWDEARGRLYVADGNSDAVSIVDTRTNAVVATITIAPFRERGIGLSPTAVALSPDGGTLYVALGGVNAVAVYRIAGQPAGRAAELRGLIPTAWYPSSLDVSADGKYLAVGALFGVGAGTGRNGGKTDRYVFAERGSVSVVEIPGDPQLAAYSVAVAENAHLSLGGTPLAVAARRSVSPRAVPERPGEPSLINHVVYILKENRTYDQVLGDLGRGDGDSSLVMYGRAVTPNHHALAEQFVTLDRTFANGGNSADGHQWITQANATEYTTWPLYTGRSYPFDGLDALAISSGGFVWDAAASKGKSVAVFGEYVKGTDATPAGRAAVMERYRAQNGDPAYFHTYLKSRFTTRSAIRSLDRVLVRDHPGWDEDIPDVVRAADMLAHLRDWEARRAMPNLVIIMLPDDHTVGTGAGWCTPRACVANNDLGMGQLVEGLSHSSFWTDMAIFVIEDDAQGGVDHVDGHRTVALTISPYAKRGIVDHTFYNQPSVLKTIELMLGLPALSLFDLVATDMRASFLEPGEPPEFTPYVALVPEQSLYETNQRVGSILGPDAAARRRAALASARMRFDGPDRAPSDALNRILWHDARGWRTPYPAVRSSLFFPLAVDVDDDAREVGRKRR